MYDYSNQYSDYAEGRAPNSPQPPTRYSRQPSTRHSSDHASRTSVGGLSSNQESSQVDTEGAPSAPSSASWANQEVQQAIWPVDRNAARAVSEDASASAIDDAVRAARLGQAAFSENDSDQVSKEGVARAVSAPVAPVVSSRTTDADPPAPKSSGLKTFALGFLGGLAACVLAGIVFGVWWGGQIVSGVVGQVLQPSTQPVETASKQAATEATTKIVSQEDETLAEAVAAKALPSVVYIGVYQSHSAYGPYGRDGSDEDLTQTALGSGIVLTEDGYILTNNHVISDAEALKVNISGVEYDAEVVGADPSSDVAVIKAIGAEGLVPADIGDSDDLVVGEWVMTIGSPFGLEQSVATGVVSATSRSTVMDNSSSNGVSQGQGSTTIYTNLIQTDAAINPGNSGGALVNAEGEVIGVNTLISSYSGSYSGVGFAIPINYAMSIADQIIAGETPTHAQLGVAVSTVNSSVAKRNNLPVNSGAYVSQVLAGSGADEAGIQVGDIIVGIDDVKVASASDVPVLVRSRNPGDTVEVTLVRGDQTITLSAVLGDDAA